VPGPWWRRWPSPPPRRPARLRTPSGLALAALTAGLVGVVAVRDAGWVAGTCLVAALATWSFLLSGGTGCQATALGIVAVPLRAAPAVPWLLRPLAHLGSQERRGAALPVVRAVLVAALLLAVFGALFATADAAFRELLARLALPAPGPLLPVRLLVLLAAAALVGAASLVAAAPARRCASMPYAGRVLRPVEWVLPLVLLDLLFAAFVTVQLTVLFGGRDHVLSTAGLTYAEYARQGFGQLVAAAVLTLAVVAVAARVVPASATTDRVRKALLGVLCLLTLVVLASASRRLGLYEQEYGFTRLRVSVDAAIGWLAVVLLLVLAAGLRPSAGWLAKAVVLSAAVGLLAFAAGDPDARIAERNVARFAATGSSTWATSPACPPTRCLLCKAFRNRSGPASSAPCDRNQSRGRPSTSPAYAPVPPCASSPRSGVGLSVGHPATGRVVGRPLVRRRSR